MESNLRIITNQTKLLDENELQIIPKIKSLNDKITRLRAKKFKKLTINFLIYQIG
jgi:hypothetical protein